LIKKKRSTL